MLVEVGLTVHGVRLRYQDSARVAKFPAVPSLHVTLRRSRA